MWALPTAIKRFARVLIAGIIVLVIDLVLSNLNIFNIPVIFIPIITAILNAIAKYIREKWKVSLPI